MEPDRSEAAKDVLLPFEEKFQPEYRDYYRHKRSRFVDAIEQFAGLWDCFQLLCVVWFHEMADLATTTDERQILPKTLFTAAHARFLAAMELGFSCCIGDAHCILRDGIEAVSHAYKLFNEPQLSVAWIQKGTAAYQKTFEENKKDSLFPDKQGLRALHRYYVAFSEAATHANPASVAGSPKEAGSSEAIGWEYHYFETDPAKLAVSLFTLLHVSTLMEQVFFACFEAPLGFDHRLTYMRKRFDELKEQQKRHLKDKYSLGADFLP